MRHDQGFAWFEAENDYQRARKALSRQDSAPSRGIGHIECFTG
jgi:hypothetical protein